MILKNTDIKSLFLSSKKIVCFGAGKLLKRLFEQVFEMGLIDRIYHVLDNYADHFEWEGGSFPVNSLENFLKDENNLDNVVILITTYSYHDIFEQLQSVPRLDRTECFVYPFAAHLPPPYEMPRRALGSAMKIPKRIHYFWFGGGEIPKKNQVWMESWKKYCPDYEIIRWDESNYDVTKHPYMHSAYKEKMWGFVPDYARLDVIYKYGGVYLDTDVEILKNLDPLLFDEAFCGFSSSFFIATGLGFGAVQGFPLIRQMRDYYNGISFYNPDGTLNLDDCGPHQTAVLDKLGLNHDNESWQLIEGMRVYPTDVLSPMDHLCNPTAYTRNTFTVHHFDASWFSGDKMSKRQNVLRRNHEFLEKYPLNY